MPAVEPLKDGHELGSFSCGDAALDHWLKSHARRSHKVGNARVYVLTGNDTDEVIAFYAINAAQVERQIATSKVGRNAPDPIPAILVGRLAVATGHQGRRIGAMLSRDAALRAIQVADAIGARCLLVHAKDESAAAFYKRFGFTESPTDPLNLQFSMQDLRASMDAGG